MNEYLSKFMTKNSWDMTMSTAIHPNEDGGKWHVSFYFIVKLLAEPKIQKGKSKLEIKSKIKILFVQIWPNKYFWFWFWFWLWTLFELVICKPSASFQCKLKNLRQNQNSQDQSSKKQGKIKIFKFKSKLAAQILLSRGGRYTRWQKFVECLGLTVQCF